ncbi:MAG: T9SS type A sorting domain-containing protein, partial [Candidatus Cloacimonetes bacterium]|nr:T9SS type A sorting domain-containing protein [Candidatus Cloacimonadota bacterium]
QAMDASLTLQSVVGLIDLDATQTTAADVDGNGAVQAMDASYILQYVVGLITEFPIEGGRVVVDLDEVVVSVSDFDISTIAVGETFTINISTSELLEEWNVTAFQFNFAFDGSLIEYSGYNLDGLLSDGGMAAVNAEDSNTISVGFAGAYPLVGAGAIIELEFTKLTAGNCTTLLSNFLFNTEIIVNLIDGEVLETEESDIQNISKLNGNYPNPFSSTTTISFNLNNKNTVNAEIEIFNLKGQLVKSFALVNGQTSVEWNATSQASGIYFYKMKTDGKYTSTKKMILLK